VGGSALCAADQIYSSTRVDQKGRLHIVLESGKEIVRLKAKGQSSFGDAWISQDGRTLAGP
jgi:hypothetical protein